MDYAEFQTTQPRISKPKSPFHPSRTIEAIWTLRVEDGEEVQACLTVTHWGNPQYRYNASLNIQRAALRLTGFASTTSWPMAARTIYKEPAKRYSARDHENAFLRATARLEELFREGNADVVRVFEGVEERVA